MTASHNDPFSGIPIAKLRVFDAAARHRNFVQAALELGVTQWAVSRHIKSLEARLARISHTDWRIGAANQRK